MAKRGHADDCPACRFNSLREEDKRTLDPADFAEHARKPPPPEPARRFGGLCLAGGGLLMLFLGAASQAGWLIGLSILAVIGDGVWGFVQRYQWEAALERWQPIFEEWKAEQTEVWLKRRAKSRLWPCPTCGGLSCNNQHSETVTVRTGVNRLDSRTDPR